MGVFLYLKKFLKRSAVRSTLKGLGFFLACLLFMMFTNPGDTSLAMLLVPFFTFGLGVYMVVVGIIPVFLGNIRLRIRRFIAATTSGTLVLLLLLRSLNQFTFRDAAIILVLVVVMAVYVVRADFLAEISSNRDNTGV